MNARVAILVRGRAEIAEAELVVRVVAHAPHRAVVAHSARVRDARLAGGSAHRDAGDVVEPRDRDGGIDAAIAVRVGWIVQRPARDRAVSEAGAVRVRARDLGRVVDAWNGLERHGEGCAVQRFRGIEEASDRPVCVKEARAESTDREGFERRSIGRRRKGSVGGA